MAAQYGGGVPAPRPEGQTGSHRGRTPGQEHRSRHGTGDNPGAGALRRQNRRLRRRLKKVRKARRRDNQMSVTAPLTDRRLNREVGTALDLRFNPELRNLDARIRGSEQRSNVEIPAWFQHFNDIVAQGREATQRVYAGAQQAQLGAAQQGFERTTGQIDAQQVQAQQQAAIRGSTPDMQPFMDARTGAAFQQANVQQGAGFLGQQGAIGVEHMAMQQLIGAQKMLEALQGEGRARGNLQEERRGVLRERGAAGIDLRRELRGDERQWQAIMQEFGLDVASEQNDVAQDRANRRQRERASKRTNTRLKNNEQRRRMEADRRFQLDREKFGVDRAKDNYLGPYNASGDGGDKDKKLPGLNGVKTHVTPSERRGNQQSFRAMIRRVRSGQSVGGNPDPLLTKAAAQYVYWEKRGAPGVTSHAMQRKLWKEYGIRMPVSSASGKRKGSRTTAGPKGQGPRPG